MRAEHERGACLGDGCGHVFAVSAGVDCAEVAPAAGSVIGPTRRLLCPLSGSSVSGTLTWLGVHRLTGVEVGSCECSHQVTDFL